MITAFFCVHEKYSNHVCVQYYIYMTIKLILKQNNSQIKKKIYILK